MTLDQIISKIALHYLHVPTLTPRNSDRLDIHTIGCVSIDAALRAAFEAGRAVGAGECKIDA